MKENTTRILYYRVRERMKLEFRYRRWLGNLLALVVGVLLMVATVHSGLLISDGHGSKGIIVKRTSVR